MAIGVGGIAAGTVIGNLVTKLTLDSRDYLTKVDDSIKKTTGFGNVATIAAGSVAAIGTAAVGAAAYLTKLTQATANQGDKFDKLSQRIGISVEKLSSYEHLAKLSGTSTAAMSTSVGRLSRNMNDYSQGIGEAKRAFETLGLSVKDQEGKLKSADAMMLEIADKFKEMPDGAEKTALSMELLGRSGSALIPMFNQGSKGMSQMLKEGDKFRKWTTAEAKESALLNDNMTRINLVMTGIKESIGKGLIPAFQAVIEVTRDWMFENSDLIEGALKKIPEIIQEWIIPAFSTFLQVGNIIYTSQTTQWKALVLVVEGFAKVVLYSLEKVLGGIAKVTSIIPGMGDAAKRAHESVAAASDKMSIAMGKQVESIKKTVVGYKDRKEAIDKLQDALVLKHDESRKRMERTEVEHKEFVLDVNTEVSEELKKKEEERVEAAKKRAEEIQKTESTLQDEINEMTMGKYEYSVIKLNDEYKEKEKNVEDKALLDEWYMLERGKLDEAETDRLTKELGKREKKEDEYYEHVKGFMDNYVTAAISGENMMKMATEDAQSAVRSSLEQSANARMDVLSGAITKMITGHVAEGLAEIGASGGFTVWDKIASVALYAGKIKLQLEAAKRIGDIGFMSGGWLDRNPRGGTVKEGSTTRADDVYLGSGSGANYFVSKGERIFVLNAKANQMYGDSLSFLNNSTAGFANGGEIGKVDQKKKDAQIDRIAGSLGLGLLSSVVNGWLGAGDLLQGIPAGLTAGGTHLGLTIGEMFIGKMGVQPLLSNILGFADGGEIPPLSQKEKDIWFSTKRKMWPSSDPNYLWKRVGMSKKPVLVRKGVSSGSGLLGSISKNISIKNVTKAIKSGVTDFASGLGMFSGFGELGDILGGSAGELLNKPTNIMNTVTEEISKLIYQVLSQTKIMEWLKNILGQVPGMHGIASELVNTDISKASIGQVASWLGDKLSIKNLLSAFDIFHDGGVITPTGMRPLKANEVPFAGIGQVGEVLSPAGASPVNVTINFTLQGLDRENARSAVNDYIIPEINYYLSSKGAGGI